MSVRPCERCPENAIRGERFCAQHQRALLAQLRAKGYLTGLARWRGLRQVEEEMHQKERAWEWGLDL